MMCKQNSGRFPKQNRAHICEHCVLLLRDIVSCDVLHIQDVSQENIAHS